MKKLITRSLTAVAALALLLIILRSATGGPPTVPREKDREKSERQTSPPQGGNDPQTALPAGRFVGGNGMVEPMDREVKVAAQTPGQILQIHAREGDFVEAETVLVTFENSAEQAALHAAEAEVKVAAADLAGIQRGLRKEDVEAAKAETGAALARSELSRKNLQRIEALVQSGSATPDELDRAQQAAETDVMTARAAEAKQQASLRGRRENVLAADARLQAAEARRDQAKATLSRLTVRAPIAGEILQLKYRVGEYYSPSAGEALIVLGDTRALRVRMDVEERDIASAQVGLPAFVIADAFPTRRYPGKVIEIGRRMGRKNIRTDNPSERTDTKILEVVIELEQRDGLVPGLRVMSYIETPDL